MSGTDEFAVDMSLTNKIHSSESESSEGIPEELTDKNDMINKYPGAEDRFNQTLGMTFEKFSDYKNKSPSNFGGTQKIN